MEFLFKNFSFLKGITTIAEQVSAAVTLWNCSLEVLISNLARDTGCPD
jgi:hypothetical protein